MLFGIAILIIIVLLVGIYFSNNPRILLFGVIASSPIINLFWFVHVFEALSILDIAIGLVPVLFIPSLIRKIFDGEMVYGRFFKQFLLLLSIMIIPAIHLIAKGQVTFIIESTIKLSIGFLTYLIILNYFRYNDQNNFLKAVFIAQIINVGVVLFQLLTGIGTGYSDESYITGFYGDEGTITRMAIFGIILTLPFKGNFIKSHYKLLSQIVFWTSFLILGISVSRSSLLGAAMVLTGFAIIRKKLSYLIFIIAIGAIVYVNTTLIQGNVYNKIGKEIRYLQGQKVTKQALGSGRYGRWEKAIDKFQKDDLLKKIFGTGKTIGPHGQFFDLLSVSGIYGAAIVILLYFRFTMYTLKRALNLRSKNYFSVYGFLTCLFFWALFIGANPLTNYYLQMLLTAFVAFMEIYDKWLLRNRQAKRLSAIQESALKM